MKKFIAILSSVCFENKIVEVNGHINDRYQFVADIDPVYISAQLKKYRTYPLSQCFDTLEAAKFYMLETRVKELGVAKQKVRWAENDLMIAELNLSNVEALFERLNKENAQ
jgi:hypothetical protein